MNALTKQTVGYLLGGLVAVLVAAPLLLGFAGEVQAQALGSDDFFGGQTADSFAGDAGLGDADLTETIAQIIRVALGFLGVIAVVIVLYGGFMWMTAAGNTERTGTAKKILFSGLIGLVIIVAAFAIASFVIDSITAATQGPGGGSSSG